MNKNNLIKKRKKGWIVLMLLFCGLFANVAMGQKTISWSGAGGNFNWGTTTNWNWSAITLAGNIPSGSNTITLTVANNDIAVGDFISGGTIPAGATVATINSPTNTIFTYIGTPTTAVATSFTFTFVTPKVGSVATVLNKTDFTVLTNDITYNVGNDANYYQRGLRNLSTSVADMTLSGAGTVNIDVFADQFYTFGGYAIQHLSTTGTKFLVDCKVKLTNTVTQFTNRNNVLRCLGHANNVLEFGSNSVLENTGVGSMVSYPLLGTVLMNGEIKGAGNFTCGAGGSTGASVGNTTFGASSNNPLFNLLTNNMAILAYANVTVNTAANNTFFKNTLGGKLQFNNLGVGLSGSVTINNANVWNSILRSSSASSDGVTGANLIINADQTTNVGAVEMAQGVISTVNTGSPVINLTVASGKSVTFGDSSANTWAAAGALPRGSGARFNIYGFDNATIKFGTSSSGLTATQLGMIVIKDGANTGAAVKLDSRGNLVLASSTTWTGGTSSDWTDAANWDNGVPDATKDVTIETGNYQPIIASAVSVKSLKLNTSTTLTVTSGFNLTVTGAVVNNGGTMTIENNANLIQGGTTNANTGNITVNRNSNVLSRLDYTIWSSPVTNNTSFLKDFSPATLDTRFYNYNETTNLYNAVLSPSTTNFVNGTGYLIRIPDTHPTTPTVWNGSFSGVPNNGDITKAVTYVDATHGYNMIGNPYPSTIDAQAFITANTAQIESSLYFWRKTNAASGSAYAIYNPLGGTAATPTSDLPNATIQVGQGFFVKAKSAGNVNFTNAMRVTNTENQFFRTKQVAKDRVWLNLTTASGVFSQALVGYVADATAGVDIYDAEYFNDSATALTSSINNIEYTIQGRPIFDPTDVVALNFKTDAAGDYSIALDHFDGVFATGQDVYLVDSKTGTETDLKAGAYTFNAASGVDNSRFSLKYQKTLKVDVNAFNENSVSVYKNNGALYINSGSIAISNIKVFDIQGRLITEQKNVKATTAVINNLRAKNQVLIVKIAGENNNVVSKKVLN